MRGKREMKKCVWVLYLLLFLLSALNTVNAEENATSITVDIAVVVEPPAPVAVSTAPPVVIQEVVVVDNSDSIDIVYDGVPEPLEKESPVIIEDTTIPKPVEEEQTWESFVDTSTPNPIEEERTSSSVTDNTIPLPIEEEKKEEFTSEVVIDNTIPKPVETPRKEESTNSTKVDREEPKPVRDSTSTTDTDRPNPVVNKKDKEKETIVDNSLPKPVDKIENSTLKPIQKDNDGGVQQTVAGSMVNQIGNTGVLPFEEESEFDERVKWEECSHTFYNRSLNTEYLEDSESHHLMITRSERVCRWCGYVTGEIREDVVPSVHIFSHDGICYRCGYKQDGDTRECRHNFLNIEVEKNSGVWKSKGKSGHWCASVKYLQQCEYCGLEQINEVADPYGGEVQKHMLNSKIENVYDYDEKNHWIVGAEMECTAKGCGYSEAVEIKSGRKKAHQFKNGYCVCGYEEKHKEESNNSDTSSVIDGALFGEGSNYAFEVLHSYVEANGGGGLYGSIVVDTVMNIGDVIKMEGVDLSEAKAIRTVQLAVDSLDGEYYVEAVEGAGALIQGLIGQNSKENKETLDEVKKANKFISEVMDKVGDRWGFGAEFQAGEMIRLEELIEGLEEADDEARKILMVSYNNAYNTNLKYEQLLQGLDKWKKVSKAVGDVTKVAGAISEACSVLSDYAVQSAKLEVVKEAMGNSSLNHLVEAVEYMENYYNSELARLFDAGTDEAISFAEGKSKVWQTVKNVFKYAPGDVDNVASSCIALVDLEEMVFEMETDLERSLVNVGNGKSEITEDELKKKMHALIDLKILSAELAQNLTWSEYKDDVLSQNVEAMENWHEQVDGVVEGWYQ